MAHRGKPFARRPAKHIVFRIVFQDFKTVLRTIFYKHVGMYYNNNNTLSILYTNDR